MDLPNVINCWSSPRTVSTSLMYSWAQRPDVQELVYVKHMAKQRLGIGRALLHQTKHFLLVREPLAVIRSFSEVCEPTLHETCYPALCELYSELRCLGRPPPVVLSDDLVKDPEGTLSALCAALGLPFEPAMLRWEPGPKPFDGVWAPWWYSNTHKATGKLGLGFERPVQRPRGPLPPHLRPLLEECWPLWEILRRHALRPQSAGVSRVPHPPPPPLLAAAAEAKPAGAAAVGATTAAALANLPSLVDEDRGQQTGQEQQGAAGAAVEQEEKSHGTHSYAPDPRNEDILIGMRDGVTGTFSLVWRPHAKVSVLESGFMLGDGVWEGMRLHQGVLLFARQHMERLFEGAKAIDLNIGLSPSQMLQLVYDTVDGNGMADASNVHIRLMVTRGLKPTPYQNPNITIGLPTVVCIPEYKQAAAGPKMDSAPLLLLSRAGPSEEWGQVVQEDGIRLFTCHVRRGSADVQDPSWNSHSKLNCIAACIQANKAGADEALMLDPHGFVATCNSVNFFIVRKGEVWAPTTKYQLHGITRQNTINLCLANGIPVRELDFTLTKAYSADEAFVTGTFGGQTPVREVDGRAIGDGQRGPVVARLQQLYRELCNQEAARGRDLLE
ncbi:hypothetical protein N2152v2_010665 [Parachlorella kessleri]